MIMTEKRADFPGVMCDHAIQRQAFDPAAFREDSSIIISRLESYLADTSVRGLALTDPAILLKQARSLMTTEHEKVPPFDRERLEKIVDLFIATGIQVHSPGFMGRQFSGIIPLSAAVDMIGAVVNQPSSFYEAGQLPNVAEKIMAEELNHFIGFDPERFTMLTTSGGSLANMTALLAARNDAYPNLWTRGQAALNLGRAPAIAASDDAHYSISRSAGVLGIGTDQIVRLPVDSRRRIRVEAIRPALDQAEKQGLHVFCLVASAGSTSVGAFDPIDEIASIASERDIWLHVDGAHGASLLVSDSLRHKLKGIELADSFAWDAHKMMFVSAASTLLFYKDKARGLGAFTDKASYVFEKEPDIYTEYNSGHKNFECTKRPMIMGLWVPWALYGRALFAEKIEYLCSLTQHFHQCLADEPDFSTIHQPESNIISFRYTPEAMSDSKLSNLQVAIRNVVRKEGKFFISKVDIEGVAALRVVFMNHRTNGEHCAMLLDKIRATGQALLAEGRPP